jgi:hypothetical protein
MPHPSVSTILAIWVIRVLGVYLGLGFLFALGFVANGVGRLDPGAQGSGIGFRLLLIPGSMAFWPLLLWRWLRGGNLSPVERNAHRHAASVTSSSRP